MLNFVFYSQPYNDLSVNLTRKPKLQNATAEFMKFFLRGAFSKSIGAPPWLRHGRGTRKIPGSNIFCKNAPASPWKADFLKPNAPKSVSMSRPGST